MYKPYKIRSIGFLFVMIILSSCKKEDLPIITTSPIINITETTALSGGTITSDGGKSVISRGVCWSENPTPTIQDQTTIDGAGGGTFTSEITRLFGGTNYFLRAYATNESGTGYGMALAFSTTGEPPSSPVVTTGNATNLQQNNATLHGTVNAKYYSTAVSFDYGTTKNYGNIITAKQSPIEGSSNVSVSADLSGLTPETTYHFRVKGGNTLGTSMGNDVTFKTYIANYAKSRIDTINNLTYFDPSAYYVYGFLFLGGQKVSTLNDPPPDITIDNDGINSILLTNNFNNSFFKYGEYLSATAAKAAFDNLKSASISQSQWIDLAYPLKENQVWIYRSETSHYAKFRIVSTQSVGSQGKPYVECRFEWVYQPNGTLTFPAK